MKEVLRERESLNKQGGSAWIVNDCEAILPCRMFPEGMRYH